MPPFTSRVGVAPKPGHVPELAQQRASLNRLIATPSFRSMQATAGNEPLFLELTGPSAGTHWVISYLAARGVYAVKNLVAGVDTPVTGLFVQPEMGAEQIESLSDAQNSWNFQARGLPIPGAWKTMAIGAGKGFAFGFFANLVQPLIIPNGYTLRFYGVVDPGNAAPGPGINSFGVIEAWGSVEQDIS